MAHVTQSDIASFTTEPAVALTELDAQLEIQADLRARLEWLQIRYDRLAYQYDQLLAARESRRRRGCRECLEAER